MRNYKVLRDKLVRKFNKLKLMRNLLVKEDFLQLKRGKLVSDKEMLFKQPITLSIMPITLKA